MKILQFLLILVSCSCLKQEQLSTNKPETDDSGVVIRMKPIWSKRTTDEDAGRTYVWLEGYTVYNNGRLFLGSKQGQPYITLLDIETGETIWKQDVRENFDPEKPYQYQNYLYMSDNKKRLLLDLETGQLVWQKDQLGFSSTYYGLDTEYFISATHWDENDLGEGVGYRGNILTGEQKPFIYPDYARQDTAKSSSRVGYLDFMKPFRVQGGKRHDQKYLLVYFKDRIHASLIDLYLGLYNLSADTWVYKKRLVQPNVGARLIVEPIIVGDVVYHAGEGFVACHKIWTGEKVWSRTFEGRDIFRDMLLIEGQLIVNSVSVYNSTDTRLYVLESSSGEIAWSIPIEGSSSRLVHLNGVVYFTATGNVRLHAIDLERRKQIWNVRSPDMDFDPRAWFTREITAVPGKDGQKGKILVYSSLSAMAFEAAR